MMCAERTFPRTPPRTTEDHPNWRSHVLVGEVNDANCHLVFGGVAGHAGAFSTAAELARLARSLLDSLGGKEGLLRADTAAYFFTPKINPGQALGWWTNRIDRSPRTFGHRGFTGTQLFIDPDSDLIAVLLSNRVHGLPPHSGPAQYTAPILSSLYRELGIGEVLEVDPWLER